MPNTIALSKKPLVLALAGAAAMIALLALALGSSTQATAAPTAQKNTAQKNIVGTAAAAGQFKTLLALAKQAGLVGALSGRGPLTLFAPTDAAFKAVPKATLQTLATNRTALRRVLLYHVVKGNATAARVAKLRSVKTLAGATISIRVRGGTVFLNGSTKVVKPDVAASNGTIHVIDKVLLPPTS
jgi:uncharacterized surface protein with fasciclin (FAS1) repeats